MLFKIKTRIRRFFSKLFQMHRPASFPYLSGDGFRAMANFVYDQFLDFDPNKVMYGDIIFVRTNYLKELDIMPFSNDDIKKAKSKNLAGYVVVYRSLGVYKE